MTTALDAMQAAVEEPKPLPLANQKEAIYRKAAMGLSLDMDEIAIVAEEDRDEYRANVHRWTTIIKARQDAATAAERDAARHALSDAETKLASESADIQKQLDDLQYRKSRLHLAVKDAQAVVDRHDHAVRRLRASVPKHVLAFVQSRKSILGSQPQFSRMRFLEGRVREIKRLSQIDVSTNAGKDLAKNHAEGEKHPELIIRVANGRFIEISVDETLWKTYIAQLKRELPAVESELAKLTAEYVSGISEIEKALDYYVT
jgi:hypothetical protein